MTNTTRQWAGFTIAPLCMTAYGVIRLTDATHGPGISWSLGHLALLASVSAFVPVMWRLRRWATAGRGQAAGLFAGFAAAAGLLGAAAATAQTVIDLAVGFLCADREAMDIMFDEVRSHPGVTPAIYTIGPLLFYVGLTLLMVQLAAIRRIAVWRPLLVVAGIAVTAMSLDFLPLGGLLLLLALAPLERQRRLAPPDVVQD
ncbi:hypothetical protein [Streptomyces nymphaeiformis]|uniref:Uncharacterized protein n=1 Tax=Streptomyces nymphaeiformis TaxID=2663842 RepID=A0A7W7XAB0_9ACTN|nr:hypothetical protein [Streptomyces nymphaeiformis]MBB4980750.1 hypothetical protein [Streptomyces nymphaeiformis]